jgi:IclR family transcriptional regulator, KDG regulon repressor
MLSSFKKVFLLLDAFTLEEPEWSLADLSRKVSMAKPTVHHIMLTLMQGGWIDREPETKKFRLGVRLWEKGWLAIRQLGVRQVARPYVQGLVEKCGETVRLGILDSVDPRWVLYIDRVESQHAVRADMEGLTRSPSYSVATGKALLAHNPDIAKRVLAQPLRPYTPGTLTQSAALLKDLALTRERGYSVNQSEFRTDVVGVAAPIRNHEGRAIAAIGLSGPAYRLGPAVVRRMGPTVAATALEISRRMGFTNQGDSHEIVPAARTRRLPVADHGKRGGTRLSNAAHRGSRGLRPRGR